MDLTPIQIPNKRKKREKKAALASKGALTKKSKLGRPPKMQSSSGDLFESTRPARKVKKNKPKTLENIKSRRKMSSLEALPTELLESILFHCTSLGLPRSSPVIAGKLSSVHVYSQILAIAFRQPEDEWWSLNPEHEDLARFQSDIIRCRWFSLQLLLRVRNTWPQHMGLNSTAEEYFNHDFEDFCEYPCKYRSDRDLSKQIEEDVDRHFSIMKSGLSLKIEIPESLLEGSWDEDMLKLFFYMVRWGAKIDWLESTHGETALVGFKNAISTGNIRALRLLILAGVDGKIDSDKVVYALRNAGEKIESIFNVIFGFGPSFTEADQRVIRRELAEMRDEAILKQDEEKMALVASILDTHSNLVWLNIQI